MFSRQSCACAIPAKLDLDVSAHYHPFMAQASPIVLPSVGHTLNDVHSRLNPTTVGPIHRPRTLAHAARLVRQAAETRGHISIAGGRHAMGGQQFAPGAAHIDTTGMHRLLDFDSASGQIEVEAGMMWPRLIDICRRLQSREVQPWTIAQKQTGADRMTIGGSIAANIHGRGLSMRPLIADVESLTLIDARGDVRSVSRACDPRLFSMVIGGYGLIGLVYSARLQLARRQVLRRDVVLARIDDMPGLFEERIAAGYLYGDLQFAIDPARETFLDEGVCSCYLPVDPRMPVPEGQRALRESDWLALLHLAHTDKSAAFERYAEHYLATDGQLYHSDTSQLTTYLDDYHVQLDARMGCTCPGTEMISEFYVPLERLPEFMRAAAAILRRTGGDVIYGTVRLIRRDSGSFLAWAKRDYACIVMNLHTPHTRAGLSRTAVSFEALTDAAIARGGSFYLTYHRFARRDQVLACYPQFPEFLRLKREGDPKCVFDSTWRRHYAGLLGVE
jgi:FAD/FMN-containing dehydrogenase